MPTTPDLGRAVKAKYPGQYDDVEDGALGRAMQQKYPGKYDDFADVVGPMGASKGTSLASPQPAAKPPLPLGLQPQSAGNTVQTVTNQPWKASPAQSLSLTSGIPEGMLNLAGQGNSIGTRLGGAAQIAAPAAAAINPSTFMRGGPQAAALAARGVQAAGAGTRAAVENLPLIGRPIRTGLRAAQKSWEGSAPQPSSPAPQGSTAAPTQYTRSLPPQAVPPGGPQTGTIPGTVQQPPAAPPPPQGSTAIPGQYSRSMPAQFPPTRTPVGSLPLNPPQGPPIAKGAPPVNPPTTPQGQPSPPVESAPTAPAANGINVSVPEGASAAERASIEAEAARIAKTQGNRLAKAQKTADYLNANPNEPIPAAGDKAGWNALFKKLGYVNSNDPSNTAAMVTEKVNRGAPTMPQPVQQQQAGPAAASVSPPNIIRSVMNAMPTSQGEGIGIAELRENLPQLSKPELDQAVMGLYRSGKISLDQHDFPQGMSQPDLDKYTVPDGKGNYFIMAGRK